MCEYRSDNKSVLKFRIKQYSLFIFTPVLFGVCSAVAADISWQGGSSSNWSDANNWSGNQLPSADDNTTVNTSTDGTVIIDGTRHSTGGLVAGAGSQNGALHITNGGSLDVRGDAVLGGGAGQNGTITVSGPNSRLEVDHGHFYFGRNGSANLTISDGAKFLTANSDKTIWAGINGQTGTSTFTVTGAGSQADINWFLMSYTDVDSGVLTSDHHTITNVTNGAVVNAAGINTAYSGKGTLNVLNATLNTGVLYGGWGQGAVSNITIAGANAVVNAYTETSIAYNGVANLVVKDGGKLVTTGVEKAGFVSGTMTTGKAYIEVKGLNSSWTSVGDTVLAFDGQAYLKVHDKAAVKTTSLYSSVSKGSDSAVYVSGVGTTLVVTDDMVIAVESASTLHVVNGGVVNGNKSYVGYSANGKGTIFVAGEGSRFYNSGEMQIGLEGSGILTAADKGHISSDGGIILAYANGSKGVLNIGTGAHAGIVEAPEINGGAGDATVNFNHIDQIDFESAMTGRLNVNHVNQGVTTLLGKSDYSGTTKVSAGTYKAGKEGVFSENSHYSAATGGVINLNNFDQSMDALTNQGRISFGDIPGTKLKVNNNYTGDGGTLYFSTVLGNDNSLTDSMDVGADTSGHSYVKVTNVGGFGAQTKDGIKIIDVVGQSDGKFSLLGDYVYKGEQVVVGGAYRYKLNQGTTSFPDNGNWYLQSDGYQKGVVPYEVYPQLLLNHLPTLQQRVGNRFWNNAGNNQLAQGADIPAGFAPSDETGVLIEENAVWGRMEGSHTSIKSRYSTSAADYDYNHFRMQAGIDGMLKETENGKLIGSITGHYDRKTANVYAQGVDSDIAVNGYGFGSTLTWYGENGFYIDNQAEATWYKSDIGADGALVNGNKGFGYSLSVETGKRITLNEYWSMTPQGQLSYANASFDSFTDRFGTEVSRKKADSLEGRLGLTVAHQDSWLNDRGMMNRRYIYGIANLYAEFLDGTEVDVSGIRFANKRDRVWGGLGLGGSYNWNDNKYSIYGEGLVLTSFNHFADSYGYKGTIGLRVKW